MVMSFLLDAYVNSIVVKQLLHLFKVYFFLFYDLKPQFRGLVEVEMVLKLQNLATDVLRSLGFQGLPYLYDFKLYCEML